MRNTWIVLKTEFINTITRRSFLLTLILVPLVPALILGAVSLFGGNQSEGDEGSNIFQPSDDIPKAEGYIDKADIIVEIPEWINEESIIEYENSEIANKAISNGDIVGYYLIEDDYLESGAVKYIREDFNPLTAMESTWIINDVLRYNILDADQKRFDAYFHPIEVEYIDISPEIQERDMSSPLAFYIPYGITLLFYILMITSASLLMNGITKEKENRVMEILMSAVKPRALLTGKILGLGLIGLLQLVVWMGSALLMLNLGGSVLKIPQNLQLPPELLFWGIIFFILGYLIYATIMAGIGALVPNMKEASQATFIIVIPLIIPMLSISVIIETPNAALPVILSLIPFTAPNTIMTRLAVGPVPVWQLLISISLMILTIWLLIRAVAGMFRAQLLVTGQKFSLKRYIRALLGKELEVEEV